MSNNVESVLNVKLGMYVDFMLYLYKQAWRHENEVKQHRNCDEVLPVPNLTHLFESVSVSAEDGIVALWKAHTRSAPSLSSLPKVAL